MNESTYETFCRDELLRRCMGNLQLLDRVLSTFQQTFNVDLEQLQQDLKHEDLGAFAKRAHKIKGASGNAGAYRVQHAAAELETAARNGQAEPLAGMMEKLREAFQEFRAVAIENPV